MDTPSLSPSPDARVEELGLELPGVPPKAGQFVPAVRTGSLLFVAGHGPLRPDGTYMLGKLGDDLEPDDGIEAARLTACAILSTLRAELGTLDKVKRIVKVNGMVNATPDFKFHPRVIDGASDLFVKVFGDRGVHARSATGYTSLPFNIAVEIELVVEVED